MPSLPLRPGEPAPWFVARSTTNPNYKFDTVAGRYIVLCFFGSMASETGRQAVEAAMACRSLFDDRRAAFFGISIDPADAAEQRVAEMLPGLRYFWDFDLAISRLYGAADAEATPGMSVSYRPMWIVLDPALRVLRVFPIAEREAALQCVAELPAPDEHAGVPLHAPVLLVPRVFEPEFCRHLIDLYERHGGSESGFMREEGGKTIPVVDHSHKRRADHIITDERVRKAAMVRIVNRVAPEIEKAFQFRATRMERYIVACYDGASGGFFNPHRDNTTKGTAHRRFAVTINLNAEEYEGGDLRFPEFGSRSYRAPTGGAVVFSCSLLHEAMPVTAGRRYAFLPFLYDEAAARVRAENNAFLGEGVSPYSLGAEEAGRPE